MKTLIPFSFVLLFAVGIAPRTSAQLLSADNPPTPAQNGTLDRIVAVVDDSVILKSELDQTLATVQHQYADHPEQLPPADVLQKQVLGRLVMNKLQIERANDNGIRVSDEEIDAAVANIAQQNKMSVPQLQAAMQQENVDYAGFRNNLRDQLLIQRLHQSVAQGSSQVSDAEIDNLVSSPAFKAGEVHLAHILVGVPEAADAKAIAAAQAKTAKVESDLHGGKDFSAEAISNSDAADALEGGDLGWRRVDELPSAFGTQIASMHPGDVTTPLRGPGGYTIIKLIERRDPSARQIVTEYHARHIMVKPTELLSDQDAQNKIQGLYQQVVNDHKDFAALAKKDSDDTTTANTGGDMGWFMRDDWGSSVGDLLSKMKPGEVSQPIRSPDGSWHLFQLLGTRQSDKTQTLQREQARQAIAARKGEEAYEEFLRELRSEAYVDIRLPHADGDTASTSSPGTP